MKIQQLLEHHGLASNPFAEEDAQSDQVFKEHCITKTYHPSWDKIYGDPLEPSTSIVFGEKGSGKTAMRLQIVRHLAEHNRRDPDRRAFVIEYDDFNRFLDRFGDRLGARQRRADRVLSQWKLWDHMDAILSLGVTRLVDMILRPASGDVESADIAERIGALDRQQRRDLLLLAACYDQSTVEPYKRRWHRLRRRLRYHVWMNRWDIAVGVLVAVVIAAVIISQRKWDWLATPWPFVMAACGWIPWLWRVQRGFRYSWGITRHVRSIERSITPLRQVLMNLRPDEVAGQPLPLKERTDDRYELLTKLQGVLKTLGYSSIFVLVDRVDEPHVINGSAEQMKALLWPMLDNKFLKHPGIGFKLLLPIELRDYAEREGRDFFQRARLDKQNMVPSLVWTGESLYDVANDRLKACASDGRTPSLRGLFDESVSDQQLIDALRSLRVPRNLFKFMYRLFMAHANSHTDEKPSWKISNGTFESVLALYRRDQDAFDRGVGAG